MSFFFGVDTIHGVRKTTCNALIIRLKLIHRFPHLYGCGHIEGRRQPMKPSQDSKFPHLYGCGHIEGNRSSGTVIPFDRFPHLYGCGHIEGRSTRERNVQGGYISASLWMRPH